MINILKVRKYMSKIKEFAMSQPKELSMHIVKLELEVMKQKKILEKALDSDKYTHEEKILITKYKNYLDSIMEVSDKILDSKKRVEKIKLLRKLTSLMNDIYRKIKPEFDKLDIGGPEYERITN